MTASVMLTGLLFAGQAWAQNQPVLPHGLDGFFGSGTGDHYTTVLLNQLFGPLFPGAGGPAAPTIFSGIIGAYNILVMTVGAVLFFYTIVAATLQTAHEGVVLGRRWSSLWAPLRVLFAVALLMPVPGFGGYNTAQVGIAWLVRGSTLIATEVWGFAARQILAGEIPLTGKGRDFDAEIFKTVYRNQLCQTIANFQFSAAGSDQRVRLVRDPANDALISQVDGRRDGICGSYLLPRVPSHLARDGIARTAGLVDRFHGLHESVLNTLISNADAIIERQWPVVLEKSGPPPPVAPRIAAAIDEARTRLEAGNRDLLARAGGASDSQARARAIIEQSIIGRSCDRDAGACSGTGWIGAGNWYMTIARLNAEIMGIMKPTVCARGSTHRSEATKPPNRTVVGEADGAGGLRRLFGGVDADKYLHLEETRRIWDTLLEDLDETTAGLSAYGFAIPAGILDQAAPETSSGLLARLWRTNFTRGVQAMIETLSPSQWADDPVVGIVTMGNWYLDIAATLIFGGMAVSVLSGSLATTITFLIAAPLAAVGLTLSFVVPLLPFFLWILAVARYFLIVVEAVAGASLWALAHLRLDGEGISGEAGRQGWMCLLALLLTPPLMIAGFLVGMILFRIVTGLLDTGMYYAMSALVNASPVVGIFGLIATGALQVTASLAVIERSFALVSEFPDRVLRWIGGQVDLTTPEHGQFRTTSGFLTATLQSGIRHMRNPINAGTRRLGRSS
ncbi:MAG: DotA/TraY family protein [Rhodobacteraceae bacterium]|nr:DotA/TraY family protein [Paracoccaceae bacterium]